MISDILILLRKDIKEIEAKVLTATIIEATKTAIVTHTPSRGKVLLVKFDPTQDSPAGILSSVQAAGYEATMAGG